MIDLSKYRVIDLSHEMWPSEQKTTGRHRHGRPCFGERPIELEEFYHADDGARMHFFRSQTHNGTHVEAAYKYDEKGNDAADTALDMYMGEAVAINFSDRSGALNPEDFGDAGVKRGDIVLAWGKPDAGLYLATETISWLIDTRIKAIAKENIRSYAPGAVSDPDNPTRNPDAAFLLAGVGMVDCVEGLHQITRPRVFFIALPLRLHRVTASWTRAIVLEER